ncbi:MAG TPA: ParB/RepB/Spo0J family partition protein [Phycisphaerales bacterium]|nr:ParB/RepB/Spo0J family partition protein [Phycisphaerales bacterium]
MAQKPRRLGRGLSSLIHPGEPVHVDQPNISQPFPEPELAPTPTTPAPSTTAAPGLPRSEPATGSRLLDVDQIRPSPFQPRRHFDEGAIAQLASSISRSGLMQPVIVRPGSGGGYELVAGERRWRAARLAGLSLLPALVRDLDDEQAAEWGLVENIQREDLNPMERAHALKALAERFALGHAELGERVGLDRSTVSNLIRLTDLEAEIQEMVGAGSLSMGHARALLAAPAGASRRRLAERAVEESWSVRRIEAVAREEAESAGPSKNPGVAPANAGQTQRAAILGDLERRITAHLGTKARIDLRAKGNRGRLVVEFYSLEHFEDVMRRIGLSDEDSA